MVAAPEFVCLGPKMLPPHQLDDAAMYARSCNPVNAAPIGQMVATMGLAFLPGTVTELPVVLPPGYLGALVNKYWGASGIELTVGFWETTAPELRNRILDHANAWSSFCNVKFRYTANVSGAQVRLTRSLEGYWSYLGTDIMLIPKSRPTMCLQGFTMNTAEAEYRRVVRHEFGHTLGFPHEHMRRDIVAKLDRAKTIAWGRTALGWSELMVVQQILTPLEESSLVQTGLVNADVLSIMTYGLPGSITKDGQPIPGGLDIDDTDKAYAAAIYPLPKAPPPPPPTGSGKLRWTPAPDDRSGRLEIVA